MRLTGFALKKTAGLTYVEASSLSDVIVFAGPNGVGKTRLLERLKLFFRAPGPSSEIALTIEATSELEEKLWGKRQLDTRDQGDCEKLRNLLQRSQKRNNYRSTILNFDSNRAITAVKPYSFSWDIGDPFEEDVGWDMSYGYLRDRFQDVQHSLFKLVESQRRKISDRAVELHKSGAKEMPLDFKDPLEKFKTAFAQLLAPKTMVDLDVKQQDLRYFYENQTLSFSTLSSGEREVINIVFDFILRNPSNCIVFFDEPELHLHPELSYKLLQTLSSTGSSNQFIFCTHSPEIITASIENSVIFLTPKKADGSNQALPVNRDDATHHALQLLGQSIGIISLGKKLLLIEGDEASLDKQTYGAILKNEFPELVLVPVGGKSTIKSFDHIRDSVLNKTVWGVEFFMLCDRDAANEIGPESLAAHLSDKLKLLPRYHLENYFLNSDILAAVFTEMEPVGSWLRDKDALEQALKDIAKEVVPYAVALKVAATLREAIGNINVMPSGIDKDTNVDKLVAEFEARAKSEVARVSASLDTPQIDALARAEHRRLLEAIESQPVALVGDIPGRVVLHKFAGKSGLKVGRLKTMYLTKTKMARPDPFEEIRALFRSFRGASNPA